jgi:hypothetical protein
VGVVRGVPLMEGVSQSRYPRSLFIRGMNNGERLVETLWEDELSAPVQRLEKSSLIGYESPAWADRSTSEIDGTRRRLAVEQLREVCGVAAHGRTGDGVVADDE